MNNCEHDWSRGIYGLAYRCKKCDVLPPLHISHGIAVECCASMFRESASLRLHIEKLEKALKEIKETLPVNPRLPIIWEIKLIVDKALMGKGEGE